MAGLMDLLGGSSASSATDRLSSGRQPSGKMGSPALTVKLRNQYTAYRADNPEEDVKWEDWLDQRGYGIGDNEHVYKKDDKSP